MGAPSSVDQVIGKEEVRKMVDAQCCSLFYFGVSTFAIPVLLVVAYMLSQGQQKYIGEIPASEAQAAADGCYIAAGVYGLCCLTSAVVYCSSSGKKEKVHASYD